MNVLITGASGKLGKVLLASPYLKNRTCFSPSRAEMDITVQDSVKQYFDEHQIGAVIHCAAMTNMPGCEKNPSEAMSVNMIGTLHLVQEAAKIPNIRFIYVSTDYVYPCVAGPYKESDTVSPFNIYAWSKFAGECGVRNIPNHCIVRTSFFDPRNILFETAPTDAFCSKIPIEDLAEGILRLLNGNFVGVGKASTGLKEKEEEGLSFVEMTKLLKPLIISEKGKEVKVKPKIVIEVGYDEIQKSPTYESGFALRFPRVIQQRLDKGPDEASMLDYVKKLYASQKKS